MTKPADEQTRKVVAAIKTIGQGLTDLANALLPQEELEEKPEPRPTDRSRQKDSPPSAEEPSDEDQAEDTEEIKLADLQGMVRDLIKKGGRPKVLKILQARGLENLSSAPEEDWPAIKAELEAAAAKK